MNKNIDNLIDSAFSADKNRIPKQPGIPPPGLLDQLSATSASGIAPVSQSASIGGVAISTTMKFVLSSLIVGSVAVGSYLYLSPAAENPPSANTPALIAIDTAAEQKSDTTTKPDLVAKQVDSSKQSTKNTIKQPHYDPLIISESDLDMPKTPPKTYQDDSTKVAISKKHK